MDLWKISLIVEDKYKNIFLEHVETIDGYVSSSLFDMKKSFTKPKLEKKVKLINDNLGEFHQNEYWSLEILVNQNPEHDVIKKIINALAQELKIEKYLTQNIINTREKKKNFIHIDKLKKINWLKENRKSFPIIEVDKFYIYGSHIKKKKLNNILPIKINASTAFGTGSHATTKCCLKSINFLSKIFSPKKVLDYGCGTGILGIAAKKLFKKSEITLVDIDQEAIKLSKHNIKLNNIVSNRLYLANNYFSYKYNKKNNYDLIVANILFSPLYDLAPLFKKNLKINCYLILSGLLNFQIPKIIKRYNQFGFIPKKVIYSSEWGAVILKMK